MDAKKPLPWGIRADLFIQLAALERAGLPADKAFSSIKLPQAFALRIEVMCKSMSRGKSIAKAGLFAGIFTPLESTLIGAACEAGSPANTYQHIGEQAALNARLSKQVRSQLIKPALILVLSLLIGPLPELAAGTVGVGAYLISVLWPLMALWLIFQLGKWLFIAAEQSPQHSLTAFILALPFFGAWYLRSQQRNFVASLAMLLEAGIPMFDAVPSALSAVSCARFRNQRILRSLQRGESLSSSLAQQAWLNHNEIITMVHTGEESGRLPEMLERVAAKLAADLNHTATQFAAWLPRIIYTALALWMASGLIGSQAFSPKIPSDL